MSAVGLLCEVIAQGVKASSEPLRGNPEYSLLMELGYLRETGVVSSVVCLDCDQPHDAEVVFVDGRYGYFCPDLGFVPVSRPALQGVTADVPKLIKHLADAFDCKRWKRTPVLNRTWRIGAVDTDHGDVMLYFQPRLRSEEDTRALGAALSNEVRSTWRLIVTAVGTLPVHGAATVLLSDLVDFEVQSGRFVPVAAPCTLVGVPSKNSGGAPNRFGVVLTAIIEDRVKNGLAVTVRNAEAKAVLAQFQKENPDARPPSLSSVKDYVTKFRSEQ